VILFLSYLNLGLLVSPRSQQELRSCGVAIGRGIHESGVATLTREGEEGTHTIVAKRREKKMRQIEGSEKGKE
jgi:hypothetical protein